MALEAHKFKIMDLTSNLAAGKSFMSLQLMIERQKFKQECKTE